MSNRVIQSQKAFGPGAMKVVGMTDCGNRMVGDVAIPVLFVGSLLNYSAILAYPQ